MASFHCLAFACASAFVLIGCGFDHGQLASDAPPAEVPTVSFGSGSTMADEASGTVEILVMLSRAASSPITVDHQVGGGTATRPDDYMLSDGTLTFAPGETEQTIAVAIAMDALEEAEETIVVELAMPVGATLGATASHTVTISSDILPRVSFKEAAASSASEGTSPDIELVLTIPPKEDVSVQLAVSGTASSADHGVSDGQVITFAAGTTSQVVPLGIVQDALDEDDETIVLELKNPSGKLLIAEANTMRVHTITDDDPPPVAAFTQATASVTEGMTAVNLTVQLSVVSGRDVTVPFSVDGSSTADDPDDYTLGSSTPLTIPAGMTSASIVVNVKADTLDEANETVVIDLETPTNATLGALKRMTLTINDDDNAPTVSFATSGSSVTEGNTSVVLTVQLSAASGRAVVVPFTIDAASTAVNPGDYTISPTSQVVITPGQTSATITIAVKEDPMKEPDETVIVVLDLPTNATLGTPMTYTLTILDDD